MITLLVFNLEPAHAFYDPLQENILKFLKKDDPLITAASDYQNVIPAITMATISRQGKWDHEIFFSEQSYNYLLFAYRQGFINRFEFTDIQDYLHILTDFKTPATKAFNRIPVRLPAISIERIRADQIQGSPYQSMITKSPLNQTVHPESPLRRPFPTQQDYWHTVVKVDPAFIAEAKSDFADASEQCQSATERCIRQVVTEKSRQFGVFLMTLATSLPELHRFEKDTLIFGSINQFLDKIYYDESPYFLPVYGQLDWNDLLAFRTNSANPATIYHPDCKTNFLEPYYIYAGATGFMRHDLYHQIVINQLPEEVRYAFALLHNSEEKAISELNSRFIALTDDEKDALYSDLNIRHPAKTQLLLGLIESRLDSDNLSEPPEHLRFSWIHPGQHEFLFPGYFADMDVTIAENDMYDEYYLANTIVSAFENIYRTRGLKFRTTFAFYIDRIVDALVQHKDELEDDYDFDAELIMKQMLRQQE